jgi:hypothetical protein
MVRYEISGKTRAMGAPMPELAPVTMALLPSRWYRLRSRTGSTLCTVLEGLFLKPKGALRAPNTLTS